MLPGYNPYNLLSFSFSLFLICYLNNIYILISECSAQSFKFHTFTVFWIFRMAYYKLGKVTHTVGHWVTKIYHIAFMTEFVLERQLIIRFVPELSTDFIIFLVIDLGALPDPPYFSLLVANHWENIRLHARIKKRVLLAKVDNIELEGESLGDIPDQEEEPLVVALGVDIILQYQVILIVLDLVDSE